MQEQDTISPVAQILATIPLAIWVWAAVLFTGFLASVLIIYAAIYVVLINTALVAIGGSTLWFISTRIYNKYIQSVRELQENEMIKVRIETAKLKKELLIQKIEIERSVPTLIKYALDSGRDIEYDKLKLIMPESKALSAIGTTTVESTVVPYHTIETSIPEGKSLLGIHPEDGRLELVDASRYQTVWFVGGSSTGKTNTVYGKVKDLVKIGAKLIICDIHSHKPDSLTRKLEEFPKIYPVGETPRDIADSILGFLREFRRRRAGGHYTDKWLLVGDEVNGTCNMIVKFSEEERKEILEDFDLELHAKGDKLLVFFKLLVEVCGYESRGFDMFGFFISQKAATLAWLRQAVMTVFAHRLLMKSEAQLAANDDPILTKKLLELPRGHTLVYGFDFSPMILKQPLYGGNS